MDTPATLRVRLWLENGDSMLLGMGRALLLTKLAELGSLNKAAKALNMSYRAAWGRLKATEAEVGEPLVEKTGPRSGFHLTPLGKELARSYILWQAEVEDFALRTARERFPWQVRPFTNDTQLNPQPDTGDNDQ